ncbi:hypothetical protein GIB67_017762 [Kingdonia uniflora]|uniref:Uncharacterized protein n=1 Tax=Kingdonia uniflora TaxID=39325 RepID=A0A7J7LQ22_9MAGN|nr:hypothetical protein GIB67_017762 [Kingdonia uniflora]
MLLMKAQSKKNKENHNKVKAPCTTGRTSMAVVHHNLVVERNVPNENVGKTTRELYPDSNKIGHDGVPAKTLSKDKKGHMMAMGIDIALSFVANTIHIVEENEDLKAINNELKTMLLNMRKDLDDHIKKTSGTLQTQRSLSYNAPSNSSQATKRKQSDLNRECKLNGYLEGIVVYGIVADVNHDVYCHNKQLRDGKQLVAVLILSELFENNIPQSPKPARVQVRALMYAFSEDDTNAVAELNSHIQKKAELIEPAVTGILNVLKACSETSGKRVVVLSSVADILMNPNWPRDRVKDEAC